MRNVTTCPSTGCARNFAGNRGIGYFCTSESTCRWLEVLQHVIIGGSRDDEDSDDEDSDDPSSDSEKKKGKKRKRRNKRMLNLIRRAHMKKSRRSIKCPWSWIFGPWMV